ncbi:hypothetical protein IC575_008578 [Cucumis melo]
MNWVWKLGKLAIPMDLKALKPYLVQLLPRLPLNHLVPSYYCVFSLICVLWLSLFILFNYDVCWILELCLRMSLILPMMHGGKSILILCSSFNSVRISSCSRKKQSYGFNPTKPYKFYSYNMGYGNFMWKHLSSFHYFVERFFELFS